MAACLKRRPISRLQWSIGTGASTCGHASCPLAAQRGVSFEVIVVDNGSSDGSAEMARDDFGARVIANTDNRGFCAANNQAFAAARGEFIALLNNDAEAAPDFLASLRRHSTRPRISGWPPPKCWSGKTRSGSIK